MTTLYDLHNLFQGIIKVIINKNDEFEEVYCDEADDLPDTWDDYPIMTIEPSEYRETCKAPCVAIYLDGDDMDDYEDEYDETYEDDDDFDPNDPYYEDLMDDYEDIIPEQIVTIRSEKCDILDNKLENMGIHYQRTIFGGEADCAVYHIYSDTEDYAEILRFAKEEGLQ